MIKNGLSFEFIELARSAYQQGTITYGKMLESLMLSYEDGKDILSQHNVYFEV
ncbi:hypothetical protein N752_17290 [Desulforamulus aquiferis]|nr:hypothetical protein N752_17290 [Desulforamulus aquiferis]